MIKSTMFCDRCKAMIPSRTNPLEQVLPYTKFEIREINSQLFHAIDIPREFHLCDTCTRSMNAWWNS